MNLLNRVLTQSTDLLLPLLAARPAWVLVGVSVLVGVGMAVLLRYTSNQVALGNAVDRARAGLLAIRLFPDNPRNMLRSLAQVATWSALRVWYSLPAVAIGVVPLAFVLSQLSLRFEHQPLTPHQAAVVKVRLDSKLSRVRESISLEAPSGVRVETPPLLDYADRAVYWRIRPTESGSTRLKLRFGATTLEKTLTVADDPSKLATVSACRPSASWLERLKHPGEPGFAVDSPVVAISVDYPRRSTPLLGCDVPWWVSFVAISLLSAVLARPLVKVRF